MVKRWNEQPDAVKSRLLTAGILLLLIPYFKPGYIHICVPLGKNLYDAARIIGAVVVFALFFSHLAHTRRLSGAAVALIVLEGWMSVDVLIHQGINVTAFAGIISALSVCLLIEMAMSRGHAAELLNAFLLLYEILIGLNFLTMLIWPDGLYYTPSELWDNWFLGYRNMFLFFFAPALSLELLNRHRTGKAARMNIVTAVCTASMALSGSATGMIAIAVFDVLYITHLYRIKLCNILTVTVAALAANISIVFLNVQQYLAPLFSLIGRKTTFTGRTTIWERTIALIQEQPLLGYGMQSEEVRGEVSGLWSGVKAHNFFLEQQYCFGIIGTVLFLALLGILIVALNKNRKHPYAASLCLGMVCYYLLMLMESHINQIPMMSFLFIACFAEPMIRQMPAAKPSERANPSSI